MALTGGFALPAHATALGGSHHDNRLIALAVAVLALLGGFALPASAQATRTWVSGVGDDANPCSRTAPCKTWAGAISKTAAAGEIDALDSAGFGALTITKAITIRAEGVVASALVSSTNGFVVQAGANDVVNIIGIEFQGINGGPNPGGLNGIRFLAGGQLNVIRCDIRNFTQNGIDIQLNQATAANVEIRDTVIQNNAGVGLNALQSSTGQLKVMVDRSLITGPGSAAASSVGVQTTGATTSVTLSDTTVGFTGADLKIVSGNLFSFGNNRVVFSPNPGASNQTILTFK